MKVFSTVMKILAALAAVAGVIYVVATYGDKIVAWAKKFLGCCQDKSCDSECCCENSECCEVTAEDLADLEAIEPEAIEPEAEVAPEADETAVQAEEADFEG